MSEKPARPKKASAKTSKDEAGVLGSLPATRATRVGGDRTRGTAAKPKAPARKPKPKAAAKPRTAAKPKAAANPAPQPATPHRPRPVRAGAPALKESTERAQKMHTAQEPSTVFELLDTVADHEIARAEALKKFVAAAQPLVASLTPEQKRRVPAFLGLGESDRGPNSGELWIFEEEED